MRAYSLGAKKEKRVMMGYGAIIRNTGDWWIGWIEEETPCQGMQTDQEQSPGW